MAENSNLTAILKFFGGAVAMALFTGLSCGTSRSMPQNAVLFMEPEGEYYVAPPCVADPAGLKKITVSEARQL